VYPGVFNPRSFKSSEVFARFIKDMKDLRGKYILDMGCGSGIVSVFAASLGGQCLAVDINPESVRCTEDNLKQNGLENNTRVIQSDLFGNIPASEKFDIIFFNPPYYEKEPSNNFEFAFNAGKGYRVIKDFIRDSKSWLKPGGCIYFIISTDTDVDSVLQAFEIHGFKYNIVTQIYKFFETFYIVKSFLS
jgi:release factor glutamine methyltransferase